MSTATADPLLALVESSLSRPVGTPDRHPVCHVVEDSIDRCLTLHPNADAKTMRIWGQASAGGWSADRESDDEDGTLPEDLDDIVDSAIGCALDARRADSDYEDTLKNAALAGKPGGW